MVCERVCDDRKVEPQIVTGDANGEIRRKRSRPQLQSGVPGGSAMLLLRAAVARSITFKY
jgi:hypothetical protein